MHFLGYGRGVRITGHIPDTLEVSDVRSAADASEGSSESGTTDREHDQSRDGSR